MTRVICDYYSPLPTTNVVIFSSGMKHSGMGFFFFQDWIYRQLCETTTPLHPQLLPLIDVYINSILTPASKSNPEATNQPVTEQEILNVFQGLTGVNYFFFYLLLCHCGCGSVRCIICLFYIVKVVFLSLIPMQSIALPCSDGHVYRGESC